MLVDHVIVVAPHIALLALLIVFCIVLQPPRLTEFALAPFAFRVAFKVVEMSLLGRCRSEVPLAGPAIMMPSRVDEMVFVMRVLVEVPVTGLTIKAVHRRSCWYVRGFFECLSWNAMVRGE